MGLILDPYRFATSSGAFDPSTLADYYAEWNPDDGSSLTLSGSDIVTMADLGATAKDFGSQLSSNRPSLSTASVNGKDTVVFDGVDELLFQNDFLYNLNGMTLSMAVKVNSQTASGGIINEADTSDSSEQYRLQARGSAQSNANKCLMFYRTNSDVNEVLQYSSANIMDGSWHVLTWQDTGTAMTLRIDGVQVATDASYTRNGSDSFAVLSLGARNNTGTYDEFLGMEFARGVVLDNGSPSGTDLDYLEQGLADHVGITI